MRCRALVREHALVLRDRESPADDRCLRQALPGRSACLQHARIHDRIVARILEIPPRP
jgi:hypothetical protein